MPQRRKDDDFDCLRCFSNKLVELGIVLRELLEFGLHCGVVLARLLKQLLHKERDQHIHKESLKLPVNN